MDLTYSADKCCFRYESLDASAVEYIRQTMMEYLQREFVDNTDFASEESCMYCTTILETETDTYAIVYYSHP